LSLTRANASKANFQFTLNQYTVWIPSEVAAELLNKAMGEKYPRGRACVLLNTLSIRELRKSDRLGARGWAWRGKDSLNSANLRDLLPPCPQDEGVWRGRAYGSDRQRM
jgi:hypothetical protein